MKTSKLWLQCALALLLIIFFVVIIRQMINSPAGLSIRQTYSKEAETVAAENAVKIQAQKDRAVWMRWKAEELKARLNSEQALQHIKNLPDKALRWAAFWWGAVASSILFMLLTSGGLAMAIYKMARSNSDTVAMLMLMRGRSREELLAAREETKLAIAQLKYAASHPDLIIDATEPIAIDAVPVKTAAECLDLSYITQEGGRFLWGFETETPVFMTLKKDGFKAAIIGMPEQGKTFKMVTLAAQAFYKGWQGIIIDLHSNTDRSLYQYLSAFTGLESIYWCTNPDDVNDTLDMIRAEHDRRLRGGSYTPLLIMIDDALSIGNSAEYEGRFETSVVKVATEGSKVGESLIVAAHNWQADSMPKQFRSNFNWRCAFRCDASESHLLFQDKRGKYSGLTPELKPGSCVLLDNTKDVHTLQGPLWDTHTLQRMADTAKHAPPIREAFEVPQELFRRLHVVDGGKRA